MATIIDPPNSVWPNGLKVDSEGYAIFYPMGTNKVDISTITWPDGYKLISPYVYDENDKIIGFVDTKAMTVSGSATTTMSYSHIEADFSSIAEGKLSVDAPNATVKKFSWAVTTDSGNSGDTIVLGTKYLGCKTLNDIKSIDSKYEINDIVNGVWAESLVDLEVGSGKIGDNGSGGMFYRCTNLISFNSDLSSLTTGEYMFYKCSNLTSFNSDLPSLTVGSSMFSNCTALTTFSIDLPNLTDGGNMFNKTNLASFSSDLSSLTNGYGMFYYCENLTSFNSDLPSLTKARSMFNNCKLNTASVQNIADTINDLTKATSDGTWLYGTIDIYIGNSTPNDQETTAFNTIASKGWTVYVNGSEYTPTQAAAITTLDERGVKTTAPIPFYAKPVKAIEEDAEYEDENGNFFNIVGAQFIYGDDLSTYGMFTCEEDAAANMRLTKIEKGDK